MSEFEYVYVLRGPLQEGFPAQREDLAELISELGGRKHLPKTWMLVEWLRARPKAAPEILEKRKKHRTALGLMTLLLALFALGPAVTAPKELLSVLLVGVVCLSAGIVSLWKRHRRLLAVPMVLAGLFYAIAGIGGGEEFKPLLVLGILLLSVAFVAILPRKKKQNRSAVEDVAALFERRASISEGQPVYIRFTPQGMQAMTQEKQSDFWSYEAVSGILETADLLVVVLDKQGFLLTKSELAEGAFSDFKSALSPRVLWLTKKGIN